MVDINKNIKFTYSTQFFLTTGALCGGRNLVKHKASFLRSNHSLHSTFLPVSVDLHKFREVPNDLTVARIKSG